MAQWQCSNCNFCGFVSDEVGMGRCPCGHVLDSLDMLRADPLLARVIDAWPGLEAKDKAAIVKLLPRKEL